MATSMAEIDNEMMAKKKDFMDLTHQMNNYNTMYNLNEQLQKVHSKSLNELDDVDNKIKSAALKTKQQYMLLDYAVNEYAMRNNLMYFTIIVICIIVLMCAYYAMEKLKMNVMLIGVFGVLIVWAAIVIIVVKVNSDRRKYAWNQYYWRSTEDSKTGKCK